VNPATRFNNLFFPETSPVRLAVLRIFLTGAWLLLFRPIWQLQTELSKHLNLLTNNDTFTDPQVMINVLSWAFSEDAIRSSPFIHAVVYATAALGVLAVIGLFSRFSLFGYALGNMILVTHNYSYGAKHHTEALYLLTLMLISLAPCGRTLSIDAWWRTRRGNIQTWGPAAKSTLYTWPIVTAQLCICMAYVFAGLCKLKLGGLEWFNGYTIQTYLLQDGVLHNRPLGVWMSQFYWPAVIISITVVTLELSFPLVMVSRRARCVILPSVACVHISIFILQAAPFFTFMTMYSLWILSDQLLNRTNKMAGTPSANQALD
jgi:hypothetical protein